MPPSPRHLTPANKAQKTQAFTASPRQNLDLKIQFATRDVTCLWGRGSPPNKQQGVCVCVRACLRQQMLERLPPRKRTDHRYVGREAAERSAVEAKEKSVQPTTRRDTTPTQDRLHSTRNRITPWRNNLEYHATEHKIAHP